MNINLLCCLVAVLSFCKANWTTPAKIFSGSSTVRATSAFFSRVTHVQHIAFLQDGIGFFYLKVYPNKTVSFPYKFPIAIDWDNWIQLDGDQEKIYIVISNTKSIYFFESNDDGKTWSNQQLKASGHPMMTLICILEDCLFSTT